MSSPHRRPRDAAAEPGDGSVPAGPLTDEQVDAILARSDPKIPVVRARLSDDGQQWEWPDRGATRRASVRWAIPRLHHEDGGRGLIMLVQPSSPQGATEDEDE